MKNSSKTHNKKQSLIGAIFGKLTIIEYAGMLPTGKKKTSAWKCKCECGNTTIVRQGNLKSGTTSSCGCIKLSENRKEDQTSLLGKKFAKLEVISFFKKERKAYGKRKTTKTYWKCLCNCGNYCIVQRNNLVSKNTKSCGCLLVEKNQKLKGKGIQSNILPSGKAAFNAYFGSYKYRSKNKSIEFSLSESEFQEIISKPCHFCGQPADRQFPTSKKLKNNPTNGVILVNGIDRMNPEIGYIKENCLPCCEICNKAKRDLTMKEFFDWINRIANHSLSLGIRTI